jgi:hypothetical protein
MRIFVALLFLTNLAAFGWFWIDTRMGGGEGVRLAQQVQPNKISLLTPQQVAALGPAKAASLADVCVEWGPLSDTEKARAVAALEPLDLVKLMSQKKVEAVTNYWVFIPPAANKVAADRRLADVKALGLKDAFLIDAGPQRFAIQLGAFRTEEGAQAQLAELADKGIKNAKVGSKAQAVLQNALVVRDPPAPAMTKLKEMLASFPGSELKVGTCDKAS